MLSVWILLLQKQIRESCNLVAAITPNHLTSLTSINNQLLLPAKALYEWKR